MWSKYGACLMPKHGEIRQVAYRETRPPFNLEIPASDDQRCILFLNLNSFPGPCHSYGYRVSHLSPKHFERGIDYLCFGEDLLFTFSIFCVHDLLYGGNRSQKHDRSVHDVRPLHRLYKRDSVSNHQYLDCLFSTLFKLT